MVLDIEKAQEDVVQCSKLQGNFDFPLAKDDACQDLVSPRDSDISPLIITTSHRAFL